jgi:hypothetical protein
MMAPAGTAVRRVVMVALLALIASAPGRVGEARPAGGAHRAAEHGGGEHGGREHSGGEHWRGEHEGGGHFGGGWSGYGGDGYPAPVYSSPGPWYYCASANAYYPYVAECPEGWQTVAP